MASGSIDSVNSPAADDGPRRLASILLDRQRACIITKTRSGNETTATCRAKSGYFVAVSFWMAEPPGVSRFSVHCHKPPPNRQPDDFTVPPHVVGADGRFVLLRARFYASYGDDEYFVYKAGSPSLDWVPLPDDDDEGTALGRVSEFGIAPRDHTTDHYLLAALCDAAPDAPSDYHLRIYSSETKAWSTRTLLNPCPGVRKIIPDKVIALGEGLLGWVDFSCGLLACDLRQDTPSVRFIPLPEPLPGNRASLPIPGAAARSFRDLVCVNGVLRFLEMEHRVAEKLGDPTTDMDVLYDSDLIDSLKRDGVDDGKPKPRDCWRAVTWSRTVGSNFWRKECTLSADDILIDESKHSSLVSKTCGRLALCDLYLAFPALSTDSDGVLYLLSVAEPGDRSGLVVAVDLGNRIVKATAACSFKHRDPSSQAFRPCTLSRHLNMTPGTEVSACREIVQAGSSTNDRKGASTRAGRPICPLKLLGKHQRPLAHDDDVSFAIPAESSNMESFRELQRQIKAEKSKFARNEGQDDPIAQAQHVINTMTLLRLVNKPYQPRNPCA